MIVVDTSVWIEAHRRPAGDTATALHSLLDADEVALAVPVRLELVAGVAKRDRPALVKALGGLAVVHPTDETWDRIATWVPIAADKGVRFGLADWLIAALAADIDALVWSLDADFADMEKLKLIRRYDG